MTKFKCFFSATVGGGGGGGAQRWDAKIKKKIEKKPIQVQLRLLYEPQIHLKTDLRVDTPRNQPM